jgi:hypothetical protein
MWRSHICSDNESKGRKGETAKENGENGQKEKKETLGKGKDKDDKDYGKD